MTDQDIAEIAGLIQHEWSMAMQNLEIVKNEQPNGTPDWDMFHMDKLQQASQREAHFNELKQRFIEEHREALNRAYGFNSDGS